MVKKRALALLLCLALLPLSGCAAMLERSHVSSAAHADYTVVEDDSVLRAETYQGLVSALLYFIREHSEGGSVRLYNYAGDVEADLAAARAEVLEQDPIGAYAVASLTCGSTRILTYYEVEVAIDYARSAEEVAAVQPLPSVSALRQELERMTAQRQEAGTFLVSYFAGDEALVERLLRQSVFDAPELYAFPAGADFGRAYSAVALYPEAGARRIVEVRVDWPTDREEARRQAEETQRAAAAFLAQRPPAGEDYGPAELAELLLAASSGEGPGTSVPREVLAGGTPDRVGFLLALEYLCRTCGMEAVAVLGRGPQPELDDWLIVSTPEGFRHLTLEPLAGGGQADGAAEPAGEGFRLYTDEELLARGYQWDAAAYPVCAGAAPEEAQALGTAEPEQP